MAKFMAKRAFPVYILLCLTLLALSSSIIACINAAFFVQPTHALRTAPLSDAHPGLDAEGYKHVRRSFYASGLSSILAGLFAIAAIFIALKLGGHKE
jgi:hypothetical protein